MADRRLETLSISVEDTGTGIDAALLPHIFDPFVTTKPEAGKGSRFSIVLPRAA